MTEAKPPRLEELTPQDVVFCRTPPEGVRMDIDAAGDMSMRFQPHMDGLYCVRPFAPLPVKDGVAGRHTMDDQEGTIRLPVTRRDGKFFTSPDWALAALACVTDGASIVPRLPNIHAALRDNAVAPDALLIPHPHTRLTAWQALLTSDATDRQVLAVIRKAGGKAMWHRLAGLGDSLDLAVTRCRPWVADTLWNHGARQLHAPAMFRAAVPLLDTLMERLGAAVMSSGSLLQIDRWPAARDGGQAWKGLDVEKVLAKWGETWRPRVLDMVREAPPAPVDLTFGHGPARHSECWSLQDWLVCWSSLAHAFQHDGVRGSSNSYARLRAVIASQRSAWLEGLLEAGLPPPVAVRKPAWSRDDFAKDGAVPLEQLFASPAASQLFEPQEMASVLGVLQRHAVAAAPARPATRPRA